MTADGMTRWLRSDPRFDTSRPSQGTIGSDLPATVVDVRVSDRARNEDSDCPVPVCLLSFGFPQWEGQYGLGGWPIRLYLADIEYGGQTHLFVALIEAKDQADLRDRLPAAERLIASIRMPVHPA